MISVKEEELRKLVLYAYLNSSYWKKIFDEKKLNPYNFTTNDLSLLPTISKTTLQLNLTDMICAERSKIVDYVCTSGTTSSPVNIPLTDNDLERLAQNEYQSLLNTGATKNDVFQICTTLDKQFMAGLAYFLGIRKLGAGIIRLGVCSAESHWNSILNIKPTYLIAVPSFVLKLISYAIENGIDLQKSSVKKIICIGENIRDFNFELNSIGKEITKKWDVALFSTYASTEMATAFTECKYGNGGHHNPDLLIIELLDDNNLPVDFGEVGELTITTLGIEGLPLIRYKTGDICIIHNEPCKCGRSSQRISPIIGRTSHRIKYMGTTLYPSAIFDILSKFNQINDYLIIIEKSELDTDQFSIYISIEGKSLINRITEAIRTVIRVRPEIKVYKSLSTIRKRYKLDNKRKLTRVIDLR